MHVPDTRAHARRDHPPAENVSSRISGKHGFELLRTKGSHQIFKNKASGKMTVVPMHKKNLPKGTMLAILKQAGIDKEELL